MVVRQFRDFALATLVFLIMGSLASAKTDADFQRELQSLLGARIQTKNGQMTVRQRKDDQGRVRKQIIAGENFSEIQLDQDADGTVDYWEVTRGPHTAIASHPLRGQFLRLVVKDRFKQGLQESTYLLNTDGRRYTLLKTKFTGRDVRYQTESANEYDTGEVTPVATSVSSSALQANIAMGSPSAIVESQDENLGWIAQQVKVFGNDSVCLDKDFTSASIAKAQREWWQILLKEDSAETASFATYLKKSNLFDPSCKKDGNKAELDGLATGLSTVMRTSAKGEPRPTDGTRGRYLRCLEQSGMGIVVAKIENHFLTADTGNNAVPLVRCEFRAGATGLAVPADSDPGDKEQIHMYMTAAVAGTGTTPFSVNGKQVSQKTAQTYQATQNYQNVLFHELIHIGGIDNEDFVYAAESCCGDPSDNRVSACGALDAIVASSKRALDVETHLSRVPEGTVPFAQGLESTFGSENGENLYNAFFAGLDKYEKGNPPKFEDGLISDAEFSKCVNGSNETACRKKWNEAVRAYADKFFSSANCKTMLPLKTEWSKCKNVSTEFKNQIAQAVTNSMITIAPGTCQGKSVAVRDSVWGEASKSWLSTTLAQLISGPQADAAAADCVGSVTVPSVQQPVVATVPKKDEVNPIANIATGISSDANRDKTISAAGSSAIGAVANSSGTRDPSSTKKPTTPSKSPLAVTKVDSASGGRSLAEDRYRRATDFVSGAAVGMERVRESLLPSAVASDGSSKSKLRLDGDASFVAFKPTTVAAVVVKLDNPFSEKRQIASIGGAAVGAATSATKVTTTNISSSFAADSGTSPARGEAGTSAEKRAARTPAAIAAAAAKAAAGAAGASGAAGNAGLAGLQKEKRDVLDGLFTWPYKDVEPRLRHMAVAEALISNKISIQDAQGRVLGSNRPKERYVYVGMDKPLRKLSD